MNKAMATAMAMTAMAAMTATTACEPEGACDVDMDCAFGQMCGVDGFCVYAPVGAAPGDGMLNPMVGDAWSDVGSMFTTTGSLDGAIGGARVDEADVVGWGDDASFGVTLTAAGRPSTFLLVQLPTSAFRTPGTSTRRSDWVQTWAQACNYDSSSYDESFVDLVVEVSPPRASTPEDQIVAEDTPDEVVDVVVSVDGEGSTVTGAFTMPLL